MIQNILLQYQAKDIKKLEINKASNSKIIYIAKNYKIKNLYKMLILSIFTK